MAGILIPVALFQRFSKVLDGSGQVPRVDEVERLVFVSPVILDIVDQKLDIGRNAVTLQMRKIAPLIMTTV